jgi:hypothetical protein
MEREWTNAELMLKISQLEERIGELEHKKTSSGIVMAGTSAIAQKYLEKKKKELASKQGEDNASKES